MLHRNDLVRLLLTLLALLIAAPVSAQMGGAPHIRAVLDAETRAPAPGSTTDIAIAMTPERPWHGYWKNGGDAGFGMEVTWALPRGVTIGELAYPVPNTLVISGLMNHVFEAPYALVAPLRIAADVPRGTRLTISGDAHWLACTDEICVPEHGVLTLDLVVGDGAPSTSFDAMRAALPQPLGGPARYAVAGERLRIAIPLPATLALTNPHLFIETPRANQPGAAQAFSRSGDSLIIETAAGADIDTMQGFAGLLRIAPGRGLAFTALPGRVPPAGEPLADAAPTSGAFDATLFLTALLGALIGGLILNVMPCVFPILSLKALALARAGGDPRTVRVEGFAYTAGAVVTALALGAILLLLRSGGEAVGWAFQLQRPESVLLLIVLMGAITANLVGLFDFGSLSFAARDGGSSPTKNAFATGALAAFIATPCTGPFLGAALGATLTLPAWAALPIFGALGLGLALPFLAIALIPALRTRLPRPGPWMVSLRRWLSVPMALTALALVWLLFRQVGPIGAAVGSGALMATLLLGGWAGRLQAREASASIALFAIAALIVPASLLLPAPSVQTTAPLANGAQPWSVAAQANALSRGHPLFVYFTADWCVSCKVNEATTIHSDAVREAFRTAGVTVLVADWTNADPAITRELARLGRNSVPLYLWYPAGAPVDALSHPQAGAPVDALSHPQAGARVDALSHPQAGAREPEILPQILTPAMLVERASATP
ncbi:MAG: thioredoxin family protein [Sphingopyxis sp.]